LTAYLSMNVFVVGNSLMATFKWGFVELLLLVESWKSQGMLPVIR